MKKFFGVIFALLLVTNSAAAADEQYLNGDKNYIYCGASMGAGYFVDRNSYSVEKYNPPYYVISVDIVEVGHYFDDWGTKIHRRRNLRFMYDYSTRKVYIYMPYADARQSMRRRYESQYKSQSKKIDNSIDWNSDWACLIPDVYYGEGTGHWGDAAEITFALAYNLKFSGDKSYEKYYHLIGGVKDSL